MANGDGTTPIWYPYTQAKLADRPLLVESAEKEFIRVIDEDGSRREIIDGISSWWVNIHGHSPKYILDRIKIQLDKHQQVIFANFTHEPAIQLVEKLLPHLPKLDVNVNIHEVYALNKAFFSDNGSTAVEVAIKMAVQYFYNQGFENKNQIIAFKDAYHGDTVGAMSSSATEVFQMAFKSLLFPVHFVDSPSPNLSKVNPRLDLHSRKLIIEELKDHAEENALNQVIEILSKKSSNIAAIIIEPLVQAAAGMKFYRKKFLQKLRRITKEFGVILIADEVFTGFGRTGAMFACKEASIVPDIICLSKALTGGVLPMGLTITTEEIYSAFHSDSKLKTFFHGHSYTGNSLACTAALASLELFEKENRLEDVKFINMMMNKELVQDPFLSDLRIIRDIRVMGAIAVIEFADDLNQGYLSDLSTWLQRKFLAKDILLRPLGNVLYFMPPYIITVESLSYVFATIREVIQELNMLGSIKANA